MGLTITKPNDFVSEQPSPTYLDPFCFNGQLRFPQRPVVLETAFKGRRWAALTAQDRTFVDKAAIGGKAEVQLGELAVKNAKSAEVKKFGQRMIDDHTKANNELTSLAAAKGMTPPAELDSKNKSTLERLSRLSGDQFDKAYMSDMVTDHEADVAEFQKQANGNGDPAIKAFASKTLPTLQEHLQLAKSIASKQK